MTTDEGKKVKEIPKEAPPEEILPPETITYTQEEVDAQLKEQYDKLNVTLSAKGARIAELEKVDPTPTLGTGKTTRGMLEVLEKMSGQYGEVEPETQAKIATLKRQLAQEEMSAVYQKQGAITKDWQGKLTHKIEEAGLDPNGEQFDTVWDAMKLAEISEGIPGFEKAEKRLDRILGLPKEEIKSEVKKPELSEKEEEEIARAYLEKTGQLTTEASVPSASSGGRIYTEAEITAMPIPEYNKLREDIDKASLEGRVK